MNKLSAVDIGGQFFGAGRKYTSLSDVGSITSLIVRGSIAVAGIILLFYFIFGGISIIAGAGNDNPQQIEKGKQAATSALIGFIVVFAAYWIVKLIEQVTGMAIL